MRYVANRCIRRIDGVGNVMELVERTVDLVDDGVNCVGSVVAWSIRELELTGFPAESGEDDTFEDFAGVRGE